MNDKAVPLAEMTFTFSRECSGDCSFVFVTVSIYVTQILNQKGLWKAGKDIRNLSK